jgi:hypothetical protein
VNLIWDFLAFQMVKFQSNYSIDVLKKFIVWTMAQMTRSSRGREDRWNSFEPPYNAKSRDDPFRTGIQDGWRFRAVSMVAEMTLRTLVSLKSNKDMRRVIPADL